MNFKLAVVVLLGLWALACLAENMDESSDRLPDLQVILPPGLGLWQEPDFLATEIVLRGNTLLKEKDLQTIIAPYIQRRLSSRDLQNLREKLTLAYVERGYINSGVIIPDQPLTTGSIYLQAIEGELNSIQVTQDFRLKPDYIAGRINRYTSGKLNINRLQAAVQLLQKDPRIAKVSAELVPGEQMGESALRVRVSEAPAWYVGFNLDNYRAESVGAERAGLSIGHLNVSGRADELHLALAESRGSTSIHVSYQLPTGRLMTGFVYDLSDASVLEAPFNSLDVESKTETISINLAWSLYRNLASEMSVTTLLETRESQTELLGQKFSLSPGALDGASKVAVIGLQLDWLARTERQVLATRLGVRKGIRALDATDSRDNPLGTIGADGDFSTWLLQAQYICQLASRIRLDTRFTAQLSEDPLLSVEKFAVGGVQTVRGVRENFLVRDNGLVFNVSFPIRIGSVTLAPFIDHGQSWDRVDTAITSSIRDTDDKRRITSAGLSLSWTIIDHLLLDVAWADIIADNFSEGEDPRDSFADQGLQDHGWHFAVSYRRRF